MALSFSSNGYEIEQSPRGLVLLRGGNHVCDIVGSFVECLRDLLKRLESPTEVEKFTININCHGLVEHLLGRSQKWRSTPKFHGETCVAPTSSLPFPLPEGYQLMNWKGKAVHSGIVLGCSSEFTPYVLEKNNASGLNIGRYRDSVADWMRYVCPLACVRLRHPALPMRKIA